MYTNENVIGLKFLHKNGDATYRILSLNPNGSFNSQGKNHLANNFPEHIGKINEWVGDGTWIPEIEPIINPEIY